MRRSNRLPADGTPPLAASRFRHRWHLVLHRFQEWQRRYRRPAHRLYRRAFFLLASHPNMGRVRDDLRPGLRSFPADEYVIIYRIEDADVLILRVVRGSRNIETLFDH